MQTEGTEQTLYSAKCQICHSPAIHRHFGVSASLFNNCFLVLLPGVVMRSLQNVLQKKHYLEVEMEVLEKEPMFPR